MESSKIHTPHFPKIPSRPVFLGNEIELLRNDEEMIGYLKGKGYTVIKDDQQDDTSHEFKIQVPKSFHRGVLFKLLE